MKKLRTYLSYGAGINSEALRLFLINQGIKFEAIYIDHDCDWPETRAFAKTIPGLTILKPDVEGFSDLYEYCLKYCMVPSLNHRWCSVKFKIVPLENYFERPCVSLIGFAVDEAHRCKESRVPGIYNQFPLVEAGMTRQDCKQLILDHGQKVPIKSGCWFCPMQKNYQWKKLSRLHPDLFEKAKILEQISMAKRIKKGKMPLTLSSNKRRLEAIVMENQLELFKNL